MIKQKAEIKECMCYWLEEITDNPMADADFVRSKKSLIYSRRVGETVHKINVAIEHHPIDCNNAAAAVYPYFTIVMDEVNNLVKEFVQGETQLGGDFTITLNGPIEQISPKGISARWYIYQSDSVPGVVSSICIFLVKWVIPFLNKYKTPADLCNAPLYGDCRVIHTQTEVLRVVAAKILCAKPTEALDIMEQWFGKPGPRRRYQPVFNYINKLIQQSNIV